MVVFQIVQSVLLTLATAVMAIATVALWRATSSYANATNKYVGLTREMLAGMRLRADEDRQEREASVRPRLMG